MYSPQVEAPSLKIMLAWAYDPDAHNRITNNAKTERPMRVAMIVLRFQAVFRTQTEITP
jgi:hypothetical protein